MRFLREGEVGFERYISALRERGEEDAFLFQKRVRSILSDVRKRGDKALLYYTQRFDHVMLRVEELQVGPKEIAEAYQKIPQEFLKTLEKAASRIRKFHRFQKERSIRSVEKGIVLGTVFRPLERVGIYVPGGKASYPSTVLMAAIPARMAGVEKIVMVSPPRKGGISPAVLVAADLARIDQIFKIGGVQAIGALAYGTETIPRVDKIVGPGNRYVAEAKKLVYGTIDIDMVAGPSEIVVISDEKTPCSFVAADLLSQAEHDEMALAILITPSEAFGNKVRDEIKRQLPTLKRRKIAQKSLRQRGAILIAKDLDHAAEIANQIAPEHLELAVSKPLRLARKIKHAGAIFLGPYTPEAIGDYLAGPNHILPTAGTARFSSPLGVEDFVKRTNLIGFTRSALQPFAEDVRRFTEWEGLQGHYLAVQKRIESRRIQSRDPKEQFPDND